jgi:hypothetical protein
VKVINGMLAGTILKTQINGVLNVLLLKLKNYVGNY